MEKQSQPLLCPKAADSVLWDVLLHMPARLDAVDPEALRALRALCSPIASGSRCDCPIEHCIRDAVAAARFVQCPPLLKAALGAGVTAALKLAVRGIHSAICAAHC